MEVLLGGLVPVSMNDYPGRAAAAVLMGGCNLKCPYCWSHRMLDRTACYTATTKKVFDEITHGKDLIEAVVFRGGEPTLQKEALHSMCTMFKSEGLLTRVHTNGTKPGVIGDLLSRNLLDRVTVDVKAPLDNPRLYSKVCGSRDKAIPENVAKTLRMCKPFNTEVDVVAPVIPGVNDKSRWLRQIAMQVRPYASVLVLQAFDATHGTLDPSFVELEEPTREDLHALGSACKPFIPTRVRTRLFGEEAL